MVYHGKLCFIVVFFLQGLHDLCTILPGTHKESKMNVANVSGNKASPLLFSLPVHSLSALSLITLSSA